MTPIERRLRPLAIALVALLVGVAIGHPFASATHRRGTAHWNCGWCFQDRPN